MNIRKLSLIIILYLSSLNLYSHALELTLDDCKKMARENYPAICQYGLIEQSKKLTLSNAAKAWIPGVSVSGFGIAMTDLVEENLLIEMQNGLYGASLTVNQIVYDGGAVSSQKRIIRAKSEVEERQADVQMYSINERVEQLYFGILMINEQIRQVSLLKDDLAISERTVRSMIKSGIANQSDLDHVLVNQVQADQHLINLGTMKKVYVQMLCHFIGKDPSEYLNGAELSLLKPSSEIYSDNTRPELSLFESQENLLVAERKSLNARITPKISAFAMGSYHNKILPIVKKGNLMGGAMLNWNIGAFYTRKNDIAILDNKKRQIEVTRETFLFNNNLQQQQTNGQIESLREQMTLDDKAVDLRERILEKAQKKVEMGTENVNELLRDVNAVSEARQQKAIHEIQLLQEICKLNTIKGK